MRKLGHLSAYHVYSENYGHKNVKSGSLSFLLSVDDSKVSLTVCAKYLGASEKSYLVLSKNFMVISNTSTL